MLTESNLRLQLCLKVSEMKEKEYCSDKAQKEKLPKTSEKKLLDEKKKKVVWDSEELNRSECNKFECISSYMLLRLLKTDWELNTERERISH